MKILIKVLIVGAPFVVPSLTLAASGVGEGVANLIIILNLIGSIVDLLLPIVFGLAILAFFWGIFRYVFGQSIDDKKDGKGIMLWALVAIFVMASLWGIVRLAQQTLGIDTGGGDFTPVQVGGL